MTNLMKYSQYIFSRSSGQTIKGFLLLEAAFGAVGRCQDQIWKSSPWASWVLYESLTKAALRPQYPFSDQIWKGLGRPAYPFIRIEQISRIFHNPRISWDVRGLGKIVGFLQLEAAFGAVYFFSNYSAQHSCQAQ